MFKRWQFPMSTRSADKNYYICFELRSDDTAYVELRDSRTDYRLTSDNSRDLVEILRIFPLSEWPQFARYLVTGTNEKMGTEQQERLF